jgi:hypothetical protein
LTLNKTTPQDVLAKTVTTPRRHPVVSHMPDTYHASAACVRLIDEDLIDDV